MCPPLLKKKKKERDSWAREGVLGSGREEVTRARGHLLFLKQFSLGDVSGGIKDEAGEQAGATPQRMTH